MLKRLQPLGRQRIPEVALFHGCTLEVWRLVFIELGEATLRSAKPSVGSSDSGWVDQFKGIW